MDLSGLLSVIEDAPALRELRKRLAEDSATRLTLGIGEGKPAALAALARGLDAPMLLIAPHPNKAEALADDLASWLGGSERVVVFPEHGLPPYEHMTADPETVAGRLHTLTRLLEDPQVIVVTSVKALAQTTISPQELREATTRLSAGDRLEMDPFLARLLELGYSVQPVVEQPGQVSRRGGLIDVFPPLSPAPARIELLGNRIESIRSFDPASQRSSQRMESLTIGPGQEVLRSAGVEERLHALHYVDFSRAQEEAEEAYRLDLETMQSGAGFQGSFFFQPLLTTATLLDHLPERTLVVCDELAALAAAGAELTQQAAAARTEMEDKGEIPVGLPDAYVAWPRLREALDEQLRFLQIARWMDADEPDVFRMPFAPATAYGGQLRRLVSEVAADGSTIIVSQQAARLGELLGEQGLSVAVQGDVAEPPAGLTLVHGAIDGGWRLQDGNTELTLLTDREVFGFSKQRRAQPRRGISRTAFLAELSQGDYVVHVEHGIGLFAGTVWRRVDGVDKEYLELRFAEGDKIFLPTDQLDRISRYVGSSEASPQLTRLGSGDWQRTKQRIRRAVVDLAQELLTLYAARETAEGIPFSTDHPWQREMEASFPYVETGDQLSAISEVKRDMESPRPMDRLVCGDVGYGKTEVALRAAFKAVMDGKQVAVLVPTTVLAQQHFSSFSQRLAAFPVRVEMLSRFRSAAEQRQVVEHLADGSVDIVIGTHRLFQKDVSFKDLGLIIIDEEQRFGVSHKEALKRLRAEVDILTLSATPIPRTLYMAMGGIRDISTMETPPEERLPIKTYVSQFDEHVVHEAIVRELERGGQVYFVHNRVHNIELIARRLRELVPEAEIAVGHGQMDEHELERVMLQFVEGQADVLVCTTIIESGLDIPNVNTIIINQADHLGLNQLYQLRGRVGRGAHRAYAYLLYDSHARLTDVAQRRLQTIFEATELGAGFQIALRDLEIRGAGNLLGSEQSGHMEAVGFDLYVRLLAEAVERLRAFQAGRQPPPPQSDDVVIDLPVTANIPTAYITDLNQRLAVYQRLSQLRDLDAVDEVARELDDRFGAMPPPLIELLEVVRLRVLALQAGVQSLTRQGSQLVLRLREGREVPRQVLAPLARRGLALGHTTMRLEIRDDWREVLATLLERLKPEETALSAPASPQG